MAKRHYTPTEDLGVAAVKLIAAKEFGWIAREQPTADYGVDAHLEVVKDGKPTGRLLGVQIKSGKSYFRQAGLGNSIRFYVDQDHYNYWVSHSLPIVIVLHRPEDDLTIWQWANHDTLKKTLKGGWYLDVPKGNLFNGTAKDDLIEHVPQSGGAALRQRFGLDLELMKVFKGREAYASVDVWINKTWCIRSIKFFLDEPEKSKADMEFGVVSLNADVGAVLHHFFPWLKAEYHAPPEDFSGEVETHILKVRLSKAGRRFIALEEFFANPPDPPDLSPPQAEESWFDEDFRYSDIPIDPYEDEIQPLDDD